MRSASTTGPVQWAAASRGDSQRVDMAFLAALAAQPAAFELRTLVDYLRLQS